jgi:NAD(P)-dependent dehydrogenase (short-subunit alcohol dehydrogenase family)
MTDATELPESGDWSAGDVPDQTGRVAVITGANSGIGLEAAKVLAGRGATVVLACRNADKAAAAEATVHAIHPDAVTLMTVLDVADLASVRAGATELLATHDRIDVLVNNAGIMAVPEQRSPDGFELQLATNHLGHFALTGLLMERLLATDGSRVVSVSSQAHRFGSMDFDDLNWERGYKSWGAYGRSKLANLLFVYELQRRLDDIGATTIAAAAHPGFSRTELQRREPGSLMDKLESLARPLMGLISQDAARGALPTLRAATDPDVQGGDYYGPNGFGEQTGPPVLVESNAASHDEADAARLWAISEELTAVAYPFPA